MTPISKAEAIDSPVVTSTAEAPTLAATTLTITAKLPSTTANLVLKLDIDKQTQLPNKIIAEVNSLGQEAVAKPEKPIIEVSTRVGEAHVLRFRPVVEDASAKTVKSDATDGESVKTGQDEDHDE
jgi:hypothetical protein